MKKYVEPVLKISKPTNENILLDIVLQSDVEIDLGDLEINE